MASSAILVSSGFTSFHPLPTKSHTPSHTPIWKGCDLLIHPGGELKMKFTDRFLRSLETKDTRYEVLEGLGFGVRVFPGGGKSFFFVYQFQGKNQRLTLGKFPEMTLAEARRKHAEARSMIEKGFNPVKVDQVAKREESESPTIVHLSDEYIEKWAKPRKRSWDEDQRILFKDVIPAWGDMKAKNVTRRDVITLLDRIVERGSPISANRTLAVIRRMFNFGVERSMLEITPCMGVRAPSQENQRDRMLTETEIKAFWNGLPQSKMDPGTKLAFKLILITGQRAGEVVNAQWSEIDQAGGWWSIPAEKAKNKLQHRIPLSRFAMDELTKIKELSGESSWLFPSPRGDNPIDETSLGHAMRKNLLLFGIENFTPHDLRRTAASHMTGMGIPRLVVSKILNHVESGITAVYDRHSYDNEKKTALDAWGEKLESIVGA